MGIENIPFEDVSMSEKDTEVEYDHAERVRMGHVDCAKVYVDQSKHGRGVFARYHCRRGDVLETGLMIRLKNVNGHENPHLHTWSDDRTVWGMPSGCIPFYNHSSHPNVKKIGDLVNDTIIVVALRDIEAGEELRNTYYSSKWRECFVDVLVESPPFTSNNHNTGTDSV